MVILGKIQQEPIQTLIQVEVIITSFLNGLALLVLLTTPAGKTSPSSVYVNKEVNMINRTRASILLYCLCALLNNAFPGEKQIEAPKYGEVTEGLQMSLSFSKVSYNSSESIHCQIILHNTSDADFTFSQFEPLTMFKFKLMDSKGAVVEPTSYGKKLIS